MSSSTSTLPLLLLTGSTGHLGFRTLLHALSSNKYRIRCAVRSVEKANTIRAHPSVVAILEHSPASANLDSASASLLSFTIVPDIQRPHTYDESLKGVDYVVHMASPLVSNRKGGVAVADDDFYEAELIRPAVRGTLGLLESAVAQKKGAGTGTGTVKRVVITSSMAAVVPSPNSNPNAASPEGQGEDGKERRVYTADNIVADNPGPYGSPFEAYAASKTAARNATRHFVERERPPFDIVNIMPSFVVGRNELVTRAEDVALGSNRVVMGQLLGNPSPVPFAGATVHVDDAALLHILALERPEKEGGKMWDFGASWDFGAETRYANAMGIVERRFPEAVKDGLLKVNGARATGTTLSRLDTKGTEEVFGMLFRGFEEQVVDVVGYYLELLAKERGESGAS